MTIIPKENIMHAANHQFQNQKARFSFTSAPELNEISHNMELENVTESNDTRTSLKFTWFHDISEIKPGHSSILSENYVAFYGIHYTAIFLLITSLISCAVLIVSILTQARREKLDFSDRFPLYLAISDFLWGISHLTDHTLLIIKKVYPTNSVATFLSLNLWFFLGYQQTMHAGLAMYIYLKVVRRVYIKLGKWEWKLHLLCIGTVSFSVVIFLPLGAFGCSGYWFLYDIQKTEGLILGVYMVCSTSLQAVCTTFGYGAIKKEISKQNRRVLNHKVENGHNQSKQRRHSLATQCLTTFVRISVVLYCTLAVSAWVQITMQVCFGVVEPLTILVIAIAANSSGWANTMGYFYNKQLKAKRSANFVSPETSNNPTGYTLTM